MAEDFRRGRSADWVVRRYRLITLSYLPRRRKEPSSSRIAWRCARRSSVAAQIFSRPSVMQTVSSRSRIPKIITRSHRVRYYHRPRKFPHPIRSNVMPGNAESRRLEVGTCPRTETGMRSPFRMHSALSPHTWKKRRATDRDKSSFFRLGTAGSEGFWVSLPCWACEIHTAIHRRPPLTMICEALR
ncbi:hypothetical protein VUR80DRAFT_1323 [Thermomyces stellatus]